MECGQRGASLAWPHPSCDCIACKPQTLDLQSAACVFREPALGCQGHKKLFGMKTRQSMGSNCVVHRRLISA